MKPATPPVPPVPPVLETPAEPVVQETPVLETPTEPVPPVPETADETENLPDVLNVMDKKSQIEYEVSRDYYLTNRSTLELVE